MVVALGPGKFYGSSLPRPRFYTDVKFNPERVDPPTPVMEPLLQWAQEAHWSMGGLSFQRLRLQGKIEGNLHNLRKEKEIAHKKAIENSTTVDLNKKSKGKKKKRADRQDSDSDEDSGSGSPPPAPMILRKTRRMSVLVDEEEDGGKKKKRRLVRKLGDDFDLVASDNVVNNPDDGIGLRTRSSRRRTMILNEEEEEDDVSDDGRKKSASGGRNEKNNVGKGSVVSNKASKKNGEKGASQSDSTPKSSGNRIRSSPRLKNKSSN